ncbi:hypothetical protein Efla_000458 [Eimeria flavescens]
MQELQQLHVLLQQLKQEHQGPQRQHQKVLTQLQQEQQEQQEQQQQKQQQLPGVPLGASPELAVAESDAMTRARSPCHDPARPVDLQNTQPANYDLLQGFYMRTLSNS